MPSVAPITVLVLGVGGNVSQGILKALAVSELRPRVVAACVSHLSTGLYAADRSYVSPYADDPEFIDWLLRVCERESVDAVVSGVEPVLERLAAEADLIRERSGAVAIVSNPERLEIGGDKLSTARWLERHGLHAPRTADAADADAVAALVAESGYPLLAKPRRGKGGHGIAEVADAGDLDYFRRQPGYLLQELLGVAAAEYTVGCFSDRNGVVRGAMVMHRGLQDGTTLWARAIEHPEVRAEAIRIAEALRPLGPCNVQLRLHRGRPTCFEINVRFSGTTPIRARLGFNDVDATLRHYVLGQEAEDLPMITEGTALRYWNEVYVDPAAILELERDGRLCEPHSHPPRLEDYGTSR